MKVIGLLRYQIFHELFAYHDPSRFGGESVGGLENQINEFYSIDEQIGAATATPPSLANPNSHGATNLLLYASYLILFHSHSTMKCSDGASEVQCF